MKQDIKKLFKFTNRKEDIENLKVKYPKYSIFFSDDDYIIVYPKLQESDYKKLVGCFGEESVINDNDISKVILSIDNIEKLVNYCNGRVVISRDELKNPYKHYKFHTKENFYRSSTKYREPNNMDVYLEKNNLKKEDLQ